MNTGTLKAAIAILAVAAPPAATAQGCKLDRLVELPVTMVGLRPMVPAKVNGKDVQFIADSGAFWSTIGPVAAAELGLELARALADCDHAVRLSPTTAASLDSRGLVHLRLGEFDKAIADDDASLRLQPQEAWSLYGRGLAKDRKGLPAEGKADVAAAVALQPGIAAEAKKYGIVP